MAFEIITTPARNLSLNNVSFWGAVFNPQVFEYQRKDVAVLSIEDGTDPNTLDITIDKPTGTVDMTNFIGSRLYVKTQNVDGFYNVISYSEPTVDTYKIVVSGLTSGIPQTGFLNSDIFRPSFRFMTKVTINESASIDLVAKHSPNSRGVCRVDLQAYLKAFTSSEDNLMNYSVLTTLDTNRFVKYTLNIAEAYGTQQTEFTFIPQEYFGSHSALQFNPYGSNMAAYVPFLIEPNENKKAKFLTTVEQPTLVIGKPFDLSFILSGEVAAKQLYCGYIPLDVNKNVVVGGLVSAALLINPFDYLNINPNGDHLLISDNSALVYEVDATEGVNRLVILDSYAAGVEFVQVYLFYLNDDNEAVRVTETKTVKVSRCDDEEGVYIKWLNLLGGWDYQLFDFRVEHAIDVSSRTYIDRLIMDYSTQNATQDVLSMAAQNRVTVGKNTVDKAGMKALSGLLTSPKVYLLTNPNPYQWQTVVVDTKGVTLYDTHNGFGNFETVLKLPKLNLQTN